MAELSFIERNNIEKFLEMGSGYVMNFSDRTFYEFIIDAVGLDIQDSKYHYSSNSKANRLRQFFKVESNYIIGKLLKSFCEYWLDRVHNEGIDYTDAENLYKETLRISEKLIADNIVEHIDSIQPNATDKDFELLAKSIKESIEKNQPESALDRLHTFVSKYFRQLCDNHSIIYTKEDSVNALFGKYSKHLINAKLIESSMTEKILKFSINILDAFNDVRNNRSFAHDNPILNYDESILIFNNISNIIRFIEKIELKNKKQMSTESDDDLPF
jgi:hypothetical protein